MPESTNPWSRVIRNALADLPAHVDERAAELNAWLAITPMEVPERTQLVDLADSLNKHILLQRELPFPSTDR